MQTCNQSLCNPYVICWIEWFLSIKSLPNLLFGVLCLPGDQSHPFAQPTINPLARCICWGGLLGRAVFPPWNEGPNSGSYTNICWIIEKARAFQRNIYFCFTDYIKPLTMWLSTNWKILKRNGNSDHITCLLRSLYAGQETTV